MHRSRRSSANQFVGSASTDEVDGPQILPAPRPMRTDPLNKGSVDARTPTLAELTQFAEQALCITPRLLAPGQFIDLGQTAPAAGSSESAESVYRVRASDTGDALVIQRLAQAEVSPFSGLLIRRARAGWPPRILFDMEPLTEGTPEVEEACRMLSLVVQQASNR